MLAADRQNRERRIFAPLKNNLSRSAPTLAFSITGEPPVVEWEDTPADIDVEELLAPEPPRPRGRRAEPLERAKSFVLEQLRSSQSPQPVEDIIQAAACAGISERTLRRAARDVGVVRVDSRSFPRRTLWRLPDNLAGLSETPVRPEFEKGETPNTPDFWPDCTKPFSEKNLDSAANILAEQAKAPGRPNFPGRPNYLEKRPRQRIEL